MLQKLFKIDYFIINNIKSTNYYCQVSIISAVMSRYNVMAKFWKSRQAILLRIVLDMLYPIILWKFNKSVYWMAKPLVVLLAKPLLVVLLNG